MAPPEPFQPSTNGFAFENSWPDEPAVSVASAFGPVNIGNASAGLCGGMVFAALDYWYAGQVPPSTQPSAGSPLYKFLVRRIIDSWHVPTGVAQYYSWMNLPDGDAGFTAFGHHVVVEHGISGRTILQQWPQIKTDLDRGIPSALGLVTVASHNPADLGHNHQVLASSYQTDGDTVTITVYDPNSGQSDGVSLAFDTSQPTKATTFTTNIDIGRPVRGFFRTAYKPVKPPAA
jgi:hypothetical protein